MAERKPRQDKDEITLARSIFDEIVEITEHEDTPKEKRAKLGAKARTESLTPERRKEIAKKAAETRWNKEKN